MPNRKTEIGFTLIEVVISILVMSLFIGVIMYLYSRSSETFKITLWKQERTAQANLFWSHMRKHLEEATNEISPATGSPNPVLTVNPCPLKFHPDPNSVADGGNLLAWNVTKTNFDFAPPFAHTSSSQKFYLSKEKHKLLLRSNGQTISSLDDVSRVEMIVVSVIKNPINNTEEIVPALDPNAVGTLVEFSVTLAPPVGYMASDLRIPQNHKFRLNVAPHSDSSPSY